MRPFHTLVLTLFVHALQAQTISTTGNFTFSPDLLTVEAGTEIGITVGGGHTMTEVDEATWNANGNTSNGGFNFSPGNHTLTLDIPGTYHYVCVPHAGMGMKGRIVVGTNTGVRENAETTVRLFPNPANGAITLATDDGNTYELQLFDLQGRQVLGRTIRNSERVEVQHLPAGQYVARITTMTGDVRIHRGITIAH